MTNTLIHKILSTRLYDIAYTAGVIDSDGWIIMASTPSSYRIAMGIKQQKPEAIELASELFGGNVRISKPDEHRFSQEPAYVWIISGRMALAALEEMANFLRIKRRQAMLAIEYQNSLNAWGAVHGRSKVPQEELERRERYYMYMRQLNHRAAAEIEREGLNPED